MFKKTEDGAGTPTAQAPSGAPSHAAESPAAAAPSRQQSGGSEQSIISAGLKITGNLESSDDIQVRGSVEGDIAGRALTVAEGANVNGSVTAEMVHILGVVEGQVDATSVKISRTGEMNGDVAYESLSIEDGAVIEGRLQRRNSGKTGGEAKLSAVKPAATKGNGASDAKAQDGKSAAS